MVFPINLIRTLNKALARRFAPARDNHLEFEEFEMSPEPQRASAAPPPPSNPPRPNSPPSLIDPFRPYSSLTFHNPLRSDSSLSLSNWSRSDSTSSPSTLSPPSNPTRPGPLPLPDAPPPPVLDLTRGKFRVDPILLAARDQARHPLLSSTTRPASPAPTLQKRPQADLPSRSPTPSADPLPPRHPANASRAPAPGLYANDALRHNHFPRR